MLNKLILSLAFLFILSACGSVAHYESTIIPVSAKHEGGIKAVRNLQRGEDQQCEISVTKKDPILKDLNSEIWTVLVCKRLYQYTITFEPQMGDKYKVTATQFLGS
jgi:hypothetical protein